jgi:WXG100 family type VII secretion target
MANRMQVDLQIMGKSAQDVSDTATQLIGVKTSMMSAIAPLQGGWLGAGGGMFQSVQARLEQDMNKINQSLAVLGEKLGTAGQRYGATDADAQSTIQQRGANAGQIATSLKF